MSHNKIDSLIKLFLDGEITENQSEELFAYLKKNPEALKNTAEVFAVDALLKSISAANSLRSGLVRSVNALERGESLKDDMRRRIMKEVERDGCSGMSVRRRTVVSPSTAWSKWASIAALFILVLSGAYFLNVEYVNQDRLGARVSVAVSGAKILREGVWMEATLGMPLLKGDQLQSAEQSGFEIKYDGEETKVKLGKSTLLAFLNPKEGKYFRLHQGRMDATVEKQVKGRPMKILTPHAEVEVLGTRFRLENADFKFTEKGEERQASATQLSVQKGLVKLKRLSDGKEVNVKAGHSLIASKNLELVVRLDRGGGEYTQGQIVFEENFDDDLSKWNVLVGDTENGFHTDLRVKDRVSLQSRESIPRGYLDVGSWMMTSATIHSSDSGENNHSVLQMKEPVEGEAFSVEAFAFVKSFFPNGSYPFMTREVLKTEYPDHVKYKTWPRSLHVRWECVSQGLGEKGFEIFEVSTFARNFQDVKNKNVFNFMRKSWIRLSDRRVALYALGEDVDVRRVVISEMIKKPVLALVDAARRSREIKK